LGVSVRTRNEAGGKKKEGRKDTLLHYGLISVSVVLFPAFRRKESTAATPCSPEKGKRKKKKKEGEKRVTLHPSLYAVVSLPNYAQVYIPRERRKGGERGKKEKKEEKEGSFLVWVWWGGPPGSHPSARRERGGKEMGRIRAKPQTVKRQFKLFRDVSAREKKKEKGGEKREEGKKNVGSSSLGTCSCRLWPRSGTELGGEKEEKEKKKKERRGKRPLLDLAVHAVSVVIGRSRAGKKGGEEKKKGKGEGGGEKCETFKAARSFSSLHLSSTILGKRGERRKEEKKGRGNEVLTFTFPRGGKVGAVG